ncbi:glycosyltransferase [Pedobacter ginsengisoli]|uniref:Glycosyltransferase n=1 Tax=Pedobacter ginsengisoli TaxID=363852 RepID=A0A2D1U8U7_9SPHI|nr:glycosyltransferase family A protein [Pedobacter ginsengisoli]ATP57992.1 glycosyltransferase [Pedobacter ginsengisoli]
MLLNNNQTVSVIIPMYNAADTIEETLHSVVNQTNKASEIIVVDDGSIDNSLGIVRDFAARHSDQNIKVIEKTNGGVSSARNAGMQIAKSSFFALLDSDDVWLPNKLERQMKVLLDNPLIDFLGSSRNNEVLKIFFKKIEVLHKASIKELLIKMYPQTSTAIFKRALYEKFGGYNEAMTHAEDGNLWIRYCANSNFYYLPESLVITGGGKPSFGHSGLSANLIEMQKGNEFTLKEAKKAKLISLPVFSVLYIFAKLKYVRRLLIILTRTK